MCGTMNDQNAQSCSFCGYIFEDFGSGTVSSGSASSSNDTSASIQNDNINKVPTPADQVSTIPSSTSTVSTGSPLFVVTRSFLATILPSLIYLFLIFAVGIYSGFSYYSILLVVLFLIIAVLPSLFSPRRFEFYDNSLKTHKIIGGDAEIPYSSLTMLDSPIRGRSQQIALSVAGQRRPIVINKNPKNQDLGVDLRQFLTSKLKKPDDVKTTGSTDPASGSSSADSSSDYGNENQPSL